MDSKKPLRASLKQLLREDNLSEKEIADLEVLHEAATEHKYSFKFNWFPRQFNLAVASFLLVCVLIGGSFYQWQTSNDLQQSIAQEALTNHLKIKTLDLETSSIIELRNFFERLNFSPFYSVLLDQTDMRLLGARYCTLQGVIALQLRFSTQEGEVVTYYQALYDKEHFGSLPDVKEGRKPYVVENQGYTMSIWKEDQVVTVMTLAI